MAGKKVTQVADPLQPISLERFYNGITATQGLIFDLVQQLRSVKSIDPAAYRKAKTMLPYVVCAVFAPPVRRKENFAYTQCFMVDIDKLGQAGMSPDGVKRLLEQDERIAMLFTSPGNDGVKALFLLKDKIHDAGYYSHFYKAFAGAFAAQYGLQQVVDYVTSDVSRCCFLSHDAAAIYRPGAVLVDAAAYMQPEIFEALPARSPTPAEQQAGVAAAAEPNRPEKAALPDEVLQQIKEVLTIAKGKQPLPAKPAPVQPEALHAMVEGLAGYLLQHGMKLVSANAIAYGKQIKVAAGNCWAEVNLYYGRQGFKVVKTTKTGSNAMLTDLAKEAMELYINLQMQPPFYAPAT